MSKTNKCIAEITLNSFVLAVSIIILKISLGYTQYSKTRLGAGTFPKAICILLMLLAFVNIVLSIIKLRKTAMAPAKVLVNRDKSGTFINRNRLIFSVALLLIYFISLISLGFLISTVWYVFVMLLLLDHKVNIWLFAISFASTAFLYTAFKIFLKVPLPAGVF